MTTEPNAKQDGSARQSTPTDPRRRRVPRTQLRRPSISARRVYRVGIIGAGEVGAALARELSVRRHPKFTPVMFFDDDAEKWNSRVHDIPVVGPPEDLRDPKRFQKLDEVIIAMPSARPKRIAEIARILQAASLSFQTVGSPDPRAAGRAWVSRLRPIEIEDLLGSEPLPLDTEKIRNVISNRVVMVTGAGGEIGGELCRQIASYQPRLLVLLEQSEGRLFEIEQELADAGCENLVVALLADVLDLPRMHDIFERYQPQVVFHAAAHKRISLMERDPCEAIKNNTLGTVCVATLAMEFLVDRFVLISTDQSFGPVNVMGATKRLAEIFVQSLSDAADNRTRFTAVRFADVLGSSCGIVPGLMRQIARGGPVKVGHSDIVQHSTGIREAVGLVMQCGAQGEGGEVFVLDQGERIWIFDLARQLIELSGLKPDEDIEIQLRGLRPGERPCEDLPDANQGIRQTQHPRIRHFQSGPLPLDQVQRDLQGLFGKLQETDADELKLMLKQLVPEYRPALGSGKSAMTATLPHATRAAPFGDPPPRSRDTGPV